MCNVFTKVCKKYVTKIYLYDLKWFAFMSPFSKTKSEELKAIFKQKDRKT